jgi:hypothetical protein
MDGWREGGREGGEYEREGRNEVHIGKIQDKTLFLLPSTIAFALLWHDNFSHGQNDILSHVKVQSFRFGTALR